MKNRLFSRSVLRRLLVMLCAMFTNGLGMTLMRFSCLGTEPFSCLNYSICEHFGISMGLSTALSTARFSCST